MRLNFFSENRNIENRSINNNSCQYGLENPRQDHLRHQQGHGHRREEERRYTQEVPKMKQGYGNEVRNDTGYGNNQNFPNYGNQIGKYRIYFSYKWSIRISQA